MTNVYVLEEILVEGATLADSTCTTYATFKSAWEWVQGRFRVLKKRAGVDFIEDGSKNNPHFAVGYMDDTLITLTIHETKLED